MSTPSHTEGPWRWEVSESGKTVRLCGGKPRYDLTVMDFTRWGMGGATPRFRHPDKPLMNIMERCVVWAKAVVGREHHADWFKTLDHPDARLIEAAPCMLAALLDAEALLMHGDFRNGNTDASGSIDEGEVHASVLIDRIRDAIAKATPIPLDKSPTL